MNELILLALPLALMAVGAISYWVGYQHGYERGTATAIGSKP